MRGRCAHHCGDDAHTRYRRGGRRQRPTEMTRDRRASSEAAFPAAPGATATATATTTTTVNKRRLDVGEAGRKNLHGGTGAGATDSQRCLACSYTKQAAKLASPVTSAASSKHRATVLDAMTRIAFRHGYTLREAKAGGDTMLSGADWLMGGHIPGFVQHRASLGRRDALAHPGIPCLGGNAPPGIEYSNTFDGALN